MVWINQCFFINEIRYAYLNINYSILESLTSTQGFYAAKLTLPILFWGVWGVLKNNLTYGAKFIKHLKAFLIVNLVFIISGVILGFLFLKVTLLPDGGAIMGFYHTELQIVVFME